MGLRTAQLQHLLVTAAFAACGPKAVESPPVPPVPEAVLRHVAVGCWAIRPDTAEPPFLEREGHLRLDTLVVSQAGEGLSFQMIPGPGITREPGVPPFTSWEPLGERDSIRIDWGDGFVGFSLRAAVIGDDLAGAGASWNDAGRGGPKRTIQGRRERCG
jgi:hypothetical protein